MIVHSNKSLAQRLERTESRSNASCVLTRKKIFPEVGAEWIEVGGTYAMFDGVDSPLTQTFGLGLFDEVTTAELEKIEAFFKKHNAPVFHEVSSMADVSLTRVLIDRGYKPVEQSTVLFQSLDRQSISDLKEDSSIKVRVIQKGEEDLWAKVASNGWATEHPSLVDLVFNFGQITTRSEGSFPFIAEKNNKAIATGALFVFDDIALLAGASTVPEAREQGAQKSLLSARLRFAFEKGCSVAMMATQPGSQSQRNAERNGFHTVYTRTKWHLQP